MQYSINNEFIIIMLGYSKGQSWCASILGTIQYIVECRRVYIYHGARAWKISILL